MKIDKEIITRNFSKRAYTYDKYADIQRGVAGELLGLMEKDAVGNILELGCGTGNYTLILRERFGRARLKAVDISAKMIERACAKFKDNDVDFIAQDAEELDLDEKFDLITSNACFQWFNDLEKALIKYKSLLNKDGVILFSIFGPETLFELSASLKHLFKNASLPLEKFMARDELCGMAGKYFRKMRLREFRYTERFSCLRELLNKIKYTGIRGEGLNGKLLLTPGSLRKLEEIYLNKFAGIRATYQGFLCSAEK